MSSNVQGLPNRPRQASGLNQTTVDRSVRARVIYEWKAGWAGAPAGRGAGSLLLAEVSFWAARSVERCRKASGRSAQRRAREGRAREVLPARRGRTDGNVEYEAAPVLARARDDNPLTRVGEVRSAGEEGVLGNRLGRAVVRVCGGGRAQIGLHIASTAIQRAAG